jgi:hypothetical protein
MSRRLRFTRNLGRRLPTPTPAREPLRYVRFEHARERIGGQAFGPFSYLDDARAVLSDEDADALERVVAWFAEHLDEPERMVPFRIVGERRARRRQRALEGGALCWFREDATAHIANARELVSLLERAGIPFVERWSDRVPGKLCSADAFQAAVVPFRDTRACEPGSRDER